MSTERISRERAGQVYGGKRPCRFCKKVDLPKYRRTFCSDECVDQHKIRTQPDFAAQKLLERDRGICSMCELDTVELLRQLHGHFLMAVARQLVDRYGGTWGNIQCKQSTWSNPITKCLHDECLEYQARSVQRKSPWVEYAITDQQFAEWCDALEIPRHCRAAKRRLWELDHILPVVEGGGDCGLENMRTLCLWCHRKETAKLAARRAQLRKQVQGG